MIDEILKIYAFYPTGDLDARSGGQHFQNVATRLSAVTPWLHDLRANRASAGGIDVLSPDLPDYYASWNEEYLREFPEDEGGFAIAATTPKIMAQFGQKVSASVSFSWSIRGSLDDIQVSLPIPSGERDQGIPTLRAIMRVLAERPGCLQIISLPSEMIFEGRAFPGFQTSGTGIWLRSDISAVDLSGAYAVEQMNGGHLILPVGHVFNLDDEKALEKVAEIDGMLAEQGMLPTIRDFPVVP